MTRLAEHLMGTVDDDRLHLRAADVYATAELSGHGPESTDSVGVPVYRAGPCW